MTSDAAEADDTEMSADRPAQAGRHVESSENDATQRADGAAASESRRRRLADIFGTVLPESTSDDTVGDGGSGRGSRDDDWYLENRPPHH